MTLTAVIPDLHGIKERVDSALDKCAELGATTIIQLGDAADCTARQAEPDLYTLNRLLDVNAVMLLGNHEVSAINPAMFLPFSGVDKTTDASKLVADLFTDGVYLAATNVGPTLITHAGVLEGPWTINGELPADSTAEHFAQMLNKHLDDAEPGKVHPLLGSIPLIRGGRDAVGGIFWADFGEHVRQLRMSQFGFNGMQIIGHTPQTQAVIGNTVAAIDSANKHGVTIAYTEDEGESWKYVITGTRSVH